jgi:hypothetical protein
LVEKNRLSTIGLSSNIPFQRTRLKQRAAERDKEGYKKKNKGPRLDTCESLMVVVKGSDAGALMRRLENGKNTRDGKPELWFQGVSSGSLQ